MSLTPPLPPMLARPAEAVPRRPDMQYDAKWDGFRAILFCRPHAPYLQARKGSDLGPAFPEIIRAAAGLAAAHGTVVLDGELVIHEAGRLDFGLLQSRARRRGPAATQAAAHHPAHLIVFDLLQLGEEVVLQRPLRERRALLEDLFVRRELGPPWTLCPSTTDPDRASEWLDPAWATVGVEGAIAKPLSLTYRPGERGWLKVRRRETHEAVVGAVTGTVHRPTSVLLGRRDEHGRLRYIGRSVPLAQPLQRDLAGYLSPASGHHPWTGRTFSVGWGTREVLDTTLVDPETVIEFSGDTAVDHGRWRHPVRLLRVRTDRQPADVPPTESPPQT